MSATHPVQPGLYRHYKGDLYRVIHTATESTNARAGRLVVIYVSLLKGTVHTRDLEEFTEEGFAEQQALGGLGDETHTRRFEWVGL